MENPNLPQKNNESIAPQPSRTPERRWLSEDSGANPHEGEVTLDLSELEDEVPETKEPHSDEEKA